MRVKSTDLTSLFEKALLDVPQNELEQIGVVVQTGDGICHVYGLNKAVYGGLVDFENGNRGIIFDLTEDSVAIFVLYKNIPVAEGEVVRKVEGVFEAPVGEELLGRVINAIGAPLDGLDPLKTKETRAVEVLPASIIEREKVNEPLETGIISVDALVPIGKVQRELIIGNRNTGKTAMAIDTILNQKGKGVYCIYVSIGQRQAKLARIIKTLEEHDALDYTVVVSADSSESVLNQYLAPYVGCSIGEHFMYNGKDALVVYDDLSNHAIAYREMSLLMRRSPGREAYPGDVFFLHARLLERSGKLLKGGSLTALPIVQIQADDITAYIPTNLISITDGQIFLDTRLFKKGNRPAVNVELSVSRVGGAAQTPAVKMLSKSLRLELAQYNELLNFAQFGTELDEISQKIIERGHVAVEVLKQAQYETYTFVDEVLLLFLLQKNFLDKVELKQVQVFVTQFISYVQSVYSQEYKKIEKDAAIDDAMNKQLKTIATEFRKIFVPA
ncbi:F0F1 ATP synthase subunit alpha [bacterium]|nr:F0F1 ATP synthase subunit alpha [bacterium]